MRQAPLVTDESPTLTATEPTGDPVENAAPTPPTEKTTYRSAERGDPLLEMFPATDVTPVHVMLTTPMALLENAATPIEPTEAYTAPPPRIVDEVTFAYATSTTALPTELAKVATPTPPTAAPVH
jgi:hypothetical protein